MTDHATLDPTDPDPGPSVERNDLDLDRLVPAPRPTWQRALVGVAIVLAVGVAARYVGTGGLYPNPDCCGMGDGGVTMALTPDSEAVATTLTFYNSSPRPILITGVTARLDGARVRATGLIPDGVVSEYPTAEFEQPSVVVEPRSFTRVLVEFTPERCDDRETDEWDVRLDLDTAGAMPAFGRTVRLSELPPDEQISYFGPASFDRYQTSFDREPLAGACALLDAATTP